MKKKEKNITDFDTANGNVFNNGFKAHAYANCLGPIIGNIGNILYVFMAIVGGLLLISLCLQGHY